VKDFIDPYFPFTLFAAAIALISALIAPTIDLKVLGIAGVTLTLGLHGAHLIDTLKGTYRTTPREVEMIIMGSTLITAVILGILLAFMTTMWFLMLVGVGAFLTVAYNFELFSGKLHDPDELGYPVFGISWGFIPSLGASMIMGNLTISTFVLAVGFGLFVVPILMLFEACKPVSHDANPLIDKSHSGGTVEESKKATYKALLLIIPALWIFVLSGVLNYIGF